MATGANTAPLGRLHPILAARGGSADTPTSNEPLGSKQALNNPELRAHLEAAKRAASMLFSEEPAKKKRRSRWGGEESRTIIPGLPTTLPPNLSEPQQKLYLLHLRIEDLSRRLRTDDLGISLNPLERSPSPEPIYSTDGKRLNTREFRARKKLEEERHESIQAAIAINPEYKPPIDYKAPTVKFEDKIFIPQDEHPLTNFVGLLIGPRGNTLKQLEKETNCKIMIRGKGATKQGKYNPMGLPQPGEDEELHALLTATSPEDLKVGMDKVNSIIKSGIENPGNENDLKRMQMMQLAELNGTFRPIDILKCSNCGSTTHRTWECSESQNVTSSIICTRCGGGGHVALDCKVDLSTLTEQPSVMEKAKMDSEYQSLMKELGEPVPDKKDSALIGSGSGSTGGVTGGVAYPPPDSLVGGNNPSGIQIQDPTAAATAQWPPMMTVPPPPGALPFPILLPPQGGGPLVPPPWMGVPMPPPPAPMMGAIPGLVPPPQGSVPAAPIPTAMTQITTQPLLEGDTSGPQQSTSSVVPPLISSNENTSSVQTSEAVPPPSSAVFPASQSPPDGAVPTSQPPLGGVVPAQPTPVAACPLIPVPSLPTANPPVPPNNNMMPPPPPPPLEQPDGSSTHAPPPPPPSEPPPPPPPS